jgi:MFS family permease
LIDYSTAPSDGEESETPSEIGALIASICDACYADAEGDSTTALFASFEDAVDSADPNQPEPQAPVKWSYVVVAAIAFAGINAAFFAPITLLLPLLCEKIDPDNKETALAWVTGVGAAVSTVANPACGAISDTWTTKLMGRRRPYVLISATTGAAGLVLLPFMETVTALALMWGWCQMTINLGYACVTASVPDQCPVAQRGILSGVLGVAQIIGIVLGLGVGQVSSNLTFD